MIGIRLASKIFGIILLYSLVGSASGLLFAQDFKYDEKNIEQIKSNPDMLWVEQKAKNRNEALQLAEKSFNERVINRYQLLKRSQYILSEFNAGSELMLDGKSLLKPLPSNKKVWKSRRYWHVIVYKEISLIEADLSDRIISNIVSNSSPLKMAYARSGNTEVAVEQAKVKLVNSLGSLTSASQEMKLSEENGVISENFSSSVSQQRMLQIQGIQSFTFQWSPKQIFAFAYVSDESLLKGDAQLAAKIETYYKEATRLRAQGSYALALENLYKAYLIGLISYKPIQIAFEAGQKPTDSNIQILNQYRELFSEAVEFTARPGYLLNDQTVTFSLQVKIIGQESPDFYIRYKDAGEEVTLKASLGRGKLNLYQPRSDQSELKLALDISPSLSNQTRGDQLLSSLEQQFKLWLTKAVTLDMSVVQKFDVHSVVIPTTREIKLQPTSRFLELNQIKWSYNGRSHRGSDWTFPISDIKQNSPLQIVLNGNVDLRYAFKIDPKTYKIQELVSEDKHSASTPIDKSESKTRVSPQTQQNPPVEVQKMEASTAEVKTNQINQRSLNFEFPRELNQLTQIRKTNILLNVLKSYSRSGWTVGNQSNMPQNGSYLYVIANQQEVLHYLFVKDNEVINQNNELVEQPQPNVGQIIIWMRKN